eukprot:TRINITY_DN67052_c1_g4_i5.p2 TRINITY_DN67052_c1_g4~~TRINITY_DN67052_c1_g4_i5.p2  ORF type:complete len:137 (-),score=9.36 TRINITY_DN67052_c1_g4_i5:492-902(-)
MCTQRCAPPGKNILLRIPQNRTLLFRSTNEISKPEKPLIALQEAHTVNAYLETLDPSTDYYYHATWSEDVNEVIDALANGEQGWRADRNLNKPVAGPGFYLTDTPALATTTNEPEFGPPNLVQATKVGSMNEWFHH